MIDSYYPWACGFVGMALAFLLLGMVAVGLFALMVAGAMLVAEYAE